MLKPESIPADVCTFVARIGRSWGTLVTGGVIVGGIWFGNSILGWQIPWSMNLAVAIGFLGVAAFNVWRDEHLMTRELQRAPLRPIEIRQRLWELQRSGRRLLEAWVNHEDAPLREAYDSLETKQIDTWNQTVKSFVGEHLSLQQYDRIRSSSMPESDLAMKVAMRTRSHHTYYVAAMMSRRLAVLEELQDEMGDD